jgi:hypothetical protein
MKNDHYTKAGIFVLVIRILNFGFVPLREDSRKFFQIEDLRIYGI